MKAGDAPGVPLRIVAHDCFNPRPPMKAGDAYRLVHLRETTVVSIRARR